MLSVEVAFSPAGEASAVVALDVDDLLARREQLQSAVLASGVASRRLLPETERPVRELGELLFTALLGTGEVAGGTARPRQWQPSADGACEWYCALMPQRWQRFRGKPCTTRPAGAYVCRQDQLVRHVGGGFGAAAAACAAAADPWSGLLSPRAARAGRRKRTRPAGPRASPARQPGTRRGALGTWGDMG